MRGSSPNPQRHVLVVEHQPHIQRLATVNLERAGYATSTAANGQEALERLRQGSPVDFVVTADVMMPVMDGLHLLKTMRSDPAFAAIPAIVLVSMIRNDIPDAHERTKAFLDERYAPCGYVVKPFNPAELVRLVGSMLEEKG